MPQSTVSRVMLVSESGKLGRYVRNVLSQEKLTRVIHFSSSINLSF